MLPKDAQIISGDDHVIEHPRVWLDRLPAKYADVGPRIVRQPDGNDAWAYEGAIAGNFALNAVAGKRPGEIGVPPPPCDGRSPPRHHNPYTLTDLHPPGGSAHPHCPS